MRAGLKRNETRPERPFPHARYTNDKCTTQAELDKRATNHSSLLRLPCLLVRTLTTMSGKTTCARDDLKKKEQNYTHKQRHTHTHTHTHTTQHTLERLRHDSSALQQFLCLPVDPPTHSSAVACARPASGDVTKMASPRLLHGAKTTLPHTAHAASAHSCARARARRVHDPPVNTNEQMLASPGRNWQRSRPWSAPDKRR